MGAIFPNLRLRRLRKTDLLRKMIAETHLSKFDLIYPLFIREDITKIQKITTMSGLYHYPLESIVDEVRSIIQLGIPAIILFGIPKIKDEIASSAYAPDGIVQKAVRCIKDEFGDKIVVITDVCLCQYMSHGHCGIVKNGEILNDPSLELLSKTALSHANAGADIVAPSDMMDGRIKAIRKKLDENNKINTIILSYAAKYASNFYGPFRGAAFSAPEFGDRNSYQMDYHNSVEALREAELDIKEGADIIMLKPALAYMDIIYQVKSKFKYPTAAYNVSGEYSMVKTAAAQGLIDEKKVVLEILTSIKRAGADLILTYFAKDVAKWLD
ncbi:MAG: porphobilinogen synthase [Candidatus Helarchaeota archaeon]